MKPVILTCEQASCNAKGPCLWDSCHAKTQLSPILTPKQWYLGMVVKVTQSN